MDFTDFQQRITELRAACGYTDNGDDKWAEEAQEFDTACFLGFSKRHVLEEAGDALVVMAAMLASRGLTLADAAQEAVAKLAQRAGERDA